MDYNSGLPDPNYIAIAQAYGLATETIRDHRDLSKIKGVLDHDGPILCNIELNPNQKMEPKLVFGRPIEDSAPLLPREEFSGNMIVKPWEAKK